MNRIGVWRTGAQARVVYEVQAHEVTHVGNCWMKGRLRACDLVTAISHAGDCFDQYQLLEGGEYRTTGSNGLNAYSIAKGARFGAYVFSTPHKRQPTEREWHLMMAGEIVNFTGVLL